MEASYRLPGDETSLRAVEIVMRWGDPLRGESKLGWQFLLGRAGGVHGEFLVSPAEIGAVQGRDRRTGFRVLNALIAERLVVKIGVERGFWRLRLRDPAHVVRERLADQTLANPQLLLPFMVDPQTTIEECAEAPPQTGCDGSRTVALAESAGRLSPAQAPPDDGPAGGTPPSASAELARRSAHVRAHEHSLKVLPSNLIPSFLASPSPSPSEASEGMDTQGASADVRAEPHKTSELVAGSAKRLPPLGSGFGARRQELRRNVADARGGLAPAAGRDEGDVAAAMRWLSGLVGGGVHVGALRRIAEALTAGRLSRTELREVAAYVQRQESEGKLKGPNRAASFVGIVKGRIFPREGLAWRVAAVTEEA